MEISMKYLVKVTADGVTGALGAVMHGYADSKTKEEIWGAAKPHVVGIATGVLEDFVLKAIEKVVADTSNTFDDAAFAVLKAPLVAEMKAQLGRI